MRLRRCLPLPASQRERRLRICRDGRAACTRDVICQVEAVDVHSCVQIVLSLCSVSRPIPPSRPPGRTASVSVSSGTSVAGPGWAVWLRRIQRSPHARIVNQVLQVPPQPRSLDIGVQQPLGTSGPFAHEAGTLRKSALRSASSTSPRSCANASCGRPLPRSGVRNISWMGQLITIHGFGITRCAAFCCAPRGRYEESV